MFFFTGIAIMIVDILKLMHFDSTFVGMTPLFVKDKNGAENSGGVCECLQSADLD